jgi:hypothetical protein
MAPREARESPRRFVAFFTRVAEQGALSIRGLSTAYAIGRSICVNWGQVDGQLIVGRDSAMYCPQCARENPEQARYCRQCGAQMLIVPEAGLAKSPDSGVEKFFKWVGYIVVGIIVLAIMSNC